MRPYFNMHSNYTIDDVGAKSDVIKTPGNEKMRVTTYVMLTELADSMKVT
jgi:hypothetical protein